MRLKPSSLTYTVFHSTDLNCFYKPKATALKLGFHLPDVKHLHWVFLRFLSENQIAKISDK